MKRYEVLVEKKKMLVDAPHVNTLALYRGMCSDYLPTTKVTILDTKEMERHTYTRELDDIGNLIRILEDGKEILG